MNFLNPIFLFGFILALIPLLIHLFNRQKVKKIEFSSVQFLKALERSKIKKLKLKQLWLLILRTLIIFLLALAFARPAIRGRHALKVGSHAKTSAVIVLDDSYPMATDTRNGSLFEQAQKMIGAGGQAKKILDLFAEGDEATILLAHRGAIYSQVQLTHNFHRLASDLARGQPSFAAGDLRSALSHAALLLDRSKNLNREIYLWSDSKSPFSPAQDSIARKFDGKLFRFPLEAGDYDNLGVEKVDFSRQLITLNVPFQVIVSVNNYRPRPAEGLLVGLYLDGQKIGQADVSLSSNQKADVKFSVTVHQPGWHWGYAELPDDDLRADNQRYFAFFVPSAINVLLVREPDRATDWLKLALNPEETSRKRIILAQATPERAATLDLSTYQVIICNEIKTPTAEWLARLNDFVQKGGGAFLILGDELDEKSYVKALTSLIPSIQIQSRQHPAALQALDSGFFTLSNYDLSHPIFQPYRAVPTRKLPEIKFYAIPSVSGTHKVTRLANFNNGQIGFFEKVSGAGRLLVLTGSIDPAKSDFVHHPFFVPFFQRSTEYLASRPTSQSENYIVADTVERWLDFAWWGKKLILEDPAQNHWDLTGRVSGDKVQLQIPHTDLPGIYFIRSGNSIVNCFAVNIEPSELISRGDKSQPRWEKEQLEQVFPLATIIQGDKNDPVNSILGSRYGRELWKPILWLATFLLLVEMVIARSQLAGSSHTP